MTFLLRTKLDREKGTVTYSTAEPIATVGVPVRTVSEANRASSEHWRVRWARSTKQRATTTVALRAASGREIFSGGHCAWIDRTPIHVHLVRLAPRKLDSDNLAGSQKHVRDAIAKFLGVDDGDEARITFSYGQEKAKWYGVRIQFYRRES